MRKIICKATGCCRLVDADSGHKYCTEHQALERADSERRKVYYENANHNLWSDMYLSPKWKALRSAKLRDCPICEICGMEATEVHHKIPHNGNWGLFLDYDNLMSICHECHVKETQKESIKRRRDYAEAKRKLWY